MVDNVVDNDVSNTGVVISNVVIARVDDGVSDGNGVVLTEIVD